MFTQSTQKKFWTFRDESDLYRFRQMANKNFIETHGAGMTEEQRQAYFLSAAEERLFLRQNELTLLDFCRRFQPAMPRTVIGTAFHYFKRFYLNNSVMDFHPKEILVTCVYLACKVEEFNVSISQFVANIKGDREKASDIILNNELLLMQQLDYHLTVHNPYRPITGLLIDIKTRSSLIDPERLRPGIMELIERLYLTDACLLYSPSQIALAAILHSVSKIQENLDSYVTGVLFGHPGMDKLANIIEAVRKIRSMVKAVEPIPKDAFRQIEKKLEVCRNQRNNPNSQIYKQRMLEMLDDDDERDYARMVQEQASNDDRVVGVTKILSPGK
ncbi:cyclin-H [Anabrus simplex]|uniref:cyclin-H n=1 Tax=Anabrus simplex TaxID=316456 RepID=UPI0035A382BF